jgi:hypothetical protein
MAQRHALESIPVGTVRRYSAFEWGAVIVTLAGYGCTGVGGVIWIPEMC